VNVRLARARQADAEARDAIALLLDRHLAQAPLMRMVSSRLLTRALARSGRSTAAAIAEDVHLPYNSLASRIQRAGGDRILALRDEMLLTRLAYSFRDPLLAWQMVAELLEVSSHRLLLRAVRRARGIPPQAWRSHVTPEGQLRLFTSFLMRNAEPWAQVSVGRATACPHCRHVFIRP